MNTDLFAFSLMMQFAVLVFWSFSLSLKLDRLEKKIDALKEKPCAGPDSKA